MRSIYFDANIYSYASRDAQVDHLRSWLDRKGWSAVASILNLIELARTGDRAQALAFVGALTRITRNHEDPPFTVLLADDQLADRVDRLPAAERFVRLSALEDWVAALLGNGSAPNDLRDWVDGHLNSVDEPALAEFWLSD